MSHVLFAESEYSNDRLRLALQVPPALNHALAHNRVPMVRRLVVQNLGGGELKDLDVTLELTGPQGRLAGPWQRRVPNIAPGRESVFDTFADFAPDVVVLATADEAFPVRYRVTVEQAATPVAELQVPSEVLAHNEWFNAPAFYDLIAAFVQPNTSSVSYVLRQAAVIIERQTGSSHLEGYQSGPERATLIAGAIYEALRGESLAYVAMPASFEDTGQKVRTTAGVLADRLGNCIDLSVTYAACLEEAGLHPLIFITRDHAFAGFFRQDTRLPEAVSLDANHLVNLVGSGMALPVELTNIGMGTGSTTFEQAVGAGRKHLDTPGEELRGMVDVHGAHRSGIRPLNSGDRREETGAADTEGQGRTASRIGLPQQLAGVLPLSSDSGAAAERSLGRTVDPVQDGAPRRIGQWRNNLLDLSLRNPLLKLPSRGKGVDLHVPAEALPRLDDLVHDHKPITVVAQDTISGVHKLAGVHRAQDLEDAILTEELVTDHRVYGHVVEQRYFTRMRELQRQARTMLQETGGNYLYLTLGALVHPSRTGEARAPLFLLPVRLEGGSGRKPYSIVPDGDEIATPNYCLIEWLRVHHELRIPELANPSTDDSGIDIVTTLARIRQSLVENNLHYRIESTASLRLLQFSTFQMWRDLATRWETITRNPVVWHLVDKAGDRFEDPRGAGDTEVDESALHLPIAADGSQMKAVTMAAQGRSFVLEGPPGTGKSQTITNLIAHTIASGQKVLFVAEKQAALDVVKRRLGSNGFGPFCLDLHGRKQSLSSIRQQLKDALHHEVTPDSHNWQAAEVAFRKRWETLRRHPQRVHENNQAGFSVWSAYEAVLAHGQGPTAEIPVSYFALPNEQCGAVEHAVRELPTALESARVRPDHPWRLSGLRSASSMDPEGFRTIADELERSRTALHQLPADLRSAVGELSGPGELESTLEAARIATSGYRVDSASVAPTLHPGWDSSFDAAYQALLQFRDQYQGVLGSLLPELFEHPELLTWHAEMEAAQRSVWRKKKKLRAVADRVRPYAQDETRVDEETVPGLLTTTAAARSAAADLMRRVVEVSGLQLPHDWRPTHTQAARAMEVAHHHALTWRNLCVKQPLLAEVYARFAAHLPLAELRLIAESWRGWLTALATTNVEFERWRNGRTWTEAWDRDGAAWTQDVRMQRLTRPHRWGAVLTQLDVLERSGLSSFASQLLNADIPARETEEAFRRGVARSALSERLASVDLELFDGATHTHEVHEYLAANARLRESVPEWLAGKLIRQRPPVSTDRSSSDGELVRQLERKRGGLSFRELLARYPDTITGLMPCFLMSPASVANFLEPGAVEFDLVVFDEASQIRVAEAVGAMGRARSVVVVGDSKQMPPTNIMEVNRGDDDIEEESTGDADVDAVPEDMDSILSECVESGLPQVWLSWHYRSSDESLIAFSNSHYYENQLASLPSPGSGPHSGVSARRVQGVYDRGTRASRTNEIEARAIVTEITRSLADPRTCERSIGVVTFNVQQRDLLLNLLEDSEDSLVQAALARRDDEALFVKNLENVQGDERDVVLFSLAFSVDPVTGQLPMNFGPLLRDGGQRRLNVAVTRARSQVILFSSFDPKDLDLDRTKSVGVRHLREYLEMAFQEVDPVGELAQQRSLRQGPVLEEIARSLRERGYEVAPRHGLSHFTVDLAVRVVGGGRWQAAVLLDGPEWAGRPTVADRDAAPELLKTIMNWPAVVRVWLPAWVNDRDAVLAEIDDAIAHASAVATDDDVPMTGPGESTDSTDTVELQDDTTGEPGGAVAELESKVASVTGVVAQETEHVSERAGEHALTDEIAGTSASSVLRGQVGVPVIDAEGTASPAPERFVGTSVHTSTGESFVAYEPSHIGSKEDMDLLDRDPRVRRLVREALVGATNTEGPVEQRRLARLVLECFGFRRSPKSRVASVLLLLPDQLASRSSALGTYVWPSKLDPATWRGFRPARQQSGDRAFEEICPEEIVNAMSHVLTQRRTLSTDELHRFTMHLLGYKKKTEKIGSILEQAEEFGINSGRLSRANYGRIGTSLPSGDEYA